jgi:predicted acetyltransferase
LTPAEVSLSPVLHGEKDRLGRMVSEYIVEMSAIIGAKPIGAYPYFDAYWEAPDRRWPYWIRNDGTGCGFALIDLADDGRLEVAEFFVARPHRRMGVGLVAARQLISERPGDWRITQRDQNARAILFWHRVLDGFVRYEEDIVTTDAVRRVQLFTFPMQDAR